MPHLRTLITALICLSLTGCVFGSNNAKGPPDSSWMADAPIPVRQGETLGDYYWWSLDLLETIKEHNRLQAAERDYYLSD